MGDGDRSATGVLDVGYLTGDYEGDQRWGRRRCDGRFLEAQAKRLAEWITVDEVFHCQNRDGHHTCWIGEAGEWSSTLRFEFREGDHGLVLDTVATINSAYPPDHQERVLSALRRRARPSGC